jgi:hypothetical protein
MTDNDEPQTIPVEVTIKLVVDSEIDPRHEHGYVPDDFKHMRFTPPVTEFLEHLDMQVTEYLAEGGGLSIVEFEILDDSPERTQNEYP